MGTRRAYTDEFKRDIIGKIGPERGAITTLAKEHGLDPSLLHGWRRKFGGASTLAPSKIDPAKGSPINAIPHPPEAAIQAPMDLVLEAVWDKAAQLPMRERFSLVATAGQRLL